MTETDRTPPRRPLAFWLVIAVVAVVVLVVLFTLVFPWLERNLSNPTIGAVRAHSLEARSATPATMGHVDVAAVVGTLTPRGW